MQVRHLQARFESSREELEEKECQVCSFQNSIEKFKVEILDLQAQLDAARSQNVDLNKKGNSLFAEVDDRRCGAERELKSLRSRYETEHKNNEILKQQLHRLKMRIPSLLQANVGRGDSAYVESLEKRIAHVKAENEMLRTKSGRLELDLEKVESKVREELTKFNSDKNNREYSEFMQGLLAVKSEEITRLKESLQKKELQLLLEVDSKAIAEKKAYQVQTQLDQAAIDTTKLKLKIEELKLKYEPDSVKVGKKMERRHYEKIPMPDESAVTFTEERRPVKGLVDRPQIKKQQRETVDEKENKPKLKLTVRKTVSISDDVDVKEMSFNDASVHEQKVPGEEREGAIGDVPKTKVKGKVHHNVKYVSSQVNENDQCKQQ
ncbi:protein Spindly-like [Lineus longissimus]|uniref:protein Spindly-like n=1 Tax=Lineus longissimus TaxID=88925 RepID=UPI00315DBFF8